MPGGFDTPPRNAGDSAGTNGDAGIHRSGWAGIGTAPRGWICRQVDAGIQSKVVLVRPCSNSLKDTAPNRIFVVMANPVRTAMIRIIGDDCSWRHNTCRELRHSLDPVRLDSHLHWI